MEHDAEESALSTWGSGQEASRARRRGDTVLRKSGPWSATVLALLRHFESIGFVGAPWPVGSGFAPDGRESLTFLPGSSAHPHAWPDDEAVVGVGRLLRAAHDAAASFVVPADAVWRPWFGRSLSGDSPVIGHCDLGPWNVVAQNGLPYALIDWEFAGPVDAVWELAQAAWLNAQLHDDDTAERFGLPSAVQRAAQVRLILDGYGLGAARRVGFVEKMIAFAVHDAKAEAVAFDVGPGSTAGVSSSGYPVLWAVTWRVRSASWMLQHQTLLEKAVLSPTAGRLSHR